MKLTLAFFVASTCLLTISAAPGDATLLEPTMRSRKGEQVIETPVKWDTRETALIIIDVWDKHWCEGANRRLATMVGRMNDVATNLRSRGSLIIHAPSDTMATYEGTPQRLLAKNAPMVTPPKPIKGWRYLEKDREGPLPIDDSDGGCDCEPQCKNFIAWKGEHLAIKIASEDAISDKGPEIFNLLRQRGIKNVLIFGVHANMCILGRTFGIRQLTDEGFNVALVRDLTDTMYNPRMAPQVPHEQGTQLVIEHIERNWCPTLLSSMILKDKP